MTSPEISLEKSISEFYPPQQKNKNKKQTKKSNKQCILKEIEQISGKNAE